MTEISSRAALVALTDDDVVRIVANMSVGREWARAAKVKYDDLKRGAPRATRGVRAAIVKDHTDFANILSHGWHLLLDPTAEPSPELDDLDDLSIRAAAAGLSLGPSGAKAMLCSVAENDRIVGSHLVRERFAELLGIAESAPQPGDEGWPPDSDGAAGPAIDGEMKDDGIAEPAPGETDSDEDEEEIIGAPSLDEIRSRAADLLDEAHMLVGLLRDAADAIEQGRPADALGDLTDTWSEAVSAVLQAAPAVGVDRPTNLHGLLEQMRAMEAERLEEESKRRDNALLALKMIGLLRDGGREEMIADTIAQFGFSSLAELDNAASGEPPTDSETELVAKASAETFDQAEGLEGSEDAEEAERAAAEENKSAKVVKATTSVIPMTETRGEQQRSPRRKSTTSTGSEIAHAQGEAQNHATPDPDGAAFNNPEVQGTSSDELNNASVPDEAVGGPDSTSEDRASATRSERVPTDTAEGDSTSSAGDPTEAQRIVSDHPPADEEVLTNSETLRDPAGEANSGSVDDLLRGLAELISHDQWAAASAVGAVMDLDDAVSRALHFCAESFCLPVISTDPRELLGRSVGDITQWLQVGGSAAVLTAVGLLRACLSVGREQSWLLTDDSLDCLPGEWREVARELRDAVAAGYLHIWDQSDALASVVAPASLKGKAEELKDELPKRGKNQKYARAGQVLRQLMSTTGALRLALDAVSNWVDGNGDVESLRVRRAALDDPRKLIDRVDAEAAAGRAKPKRAPIEYEAFDSLAARIAEVAALLDQTIVLAEERVADRPQTGPLADKVRRLVEDLPQVPSDGSLESAVLERFAVWLRDGSGPASDTGRSFTQLKFVATLPAVSAVRDKESNLPLPSKVPAGRLIHELLQQRPGTELFQAYLDKGNLAAAMLIDVDDINQLQMRQTEREWLARIEKHELNLRSELLRLQAHTQLDRIDRAKFDGQISRLTNSPDNRFDLVEARANEIADEFRSRWQVGKDELLANLDEYVLAVGISPGSEQRIRNLIAQNDLITAREFLSLLSNNSDAALPRAEDDGLMTLKEFHALIDDWPGRDARPMQVVADKIGDNTSAKTSAALRAWNQGSRALKASEWEKLLPSILSLIGLEKIPDQPISNKTERNQTRFGRFTVKANPVGGSYVAALGSKTRRKGYSVYAVMPETSVDSVFDQIPTGERREANLILYPGILSWDDRRALRISADKKQITALIIDNAVIAFMGLQTEPRFTTLQRITLPFSIFPHWAPRVAGDVPDELFVGRTEIIDKIISPEGSIFVYGGRQLGKSALLHRIERDFNRLDSKLAIYIDFKVERIGEENEPEYLWTVLRNRLHEYKVLPPTITSTKPDSIEKGIRDWLEADPDRAILLLCDESDAFLQSEARERVINNRVRSFPNVSVLKGLMDKTHRRFKPVFAGLHQVQRIADIPNSPLAHGGEDILVGPLDSTEAWELVVRPFKALGYEFESLDLVWRLLAFTNHQAGLVQIVCDELYKKMRKAQSQIPPGQPPYTITAADVDSVITSREVRDFIAERFRLTIQLEDRYFVIAMVVALLSLDHGYTNDYEASLILEFCREAWPSGFESLTEKGLSVYLDEMVGLNVLIHGNEPTHYGLRSPNVVHILGDRDTIAKQLAEGRFELPLQYNARVSRRRLSESREPEKYSPLTEQQLSQVMPKRDGSRDKYAVAVIGSPALGIDSTLQILTAASKEDYEYPLEVVSAENAAELVKAGTGVIARRPLVVCDAIDRPECLDDVVGKIAKANAGKIGRRAVLLGPFGASSLAELTASGVEILPLQLWTAETVRGIIDNPITDPTQRDEFIAATGGWPTLCEKYLNQIRARAVVPEVITRANAFPVNAEEARQFLTEVGLTDGRDLAVLGPWAALVPKDDVVSQADLVAVIESDFFDLSMLIDRLQVLSVISERSTESGPGFVLNDVVRRSLIAAGAADAS